jgi:glycosyltransferase involved in cell wall biosynthesis
MIKVFIDPTYSRADKADGGIRRVSEAQHKHLKKFGIQPVMSPDEADVIANHGAAITERPGVPCAHHGHGLMWSRYIWETWAYDVNAQVIRSMQHSVAHSAPSEWVSDAIRRGMMVYPEVIYHGIDAKDFTVNENPEGYVLWNKARTDAVSNPEDLEQVARLLPSVDFVSTFAKPTKNIEVIGTVPYDEMLPILKNASVYLATTRETFGIGTIEALASGVPVAGWDWGGQSEIIANGQTGYLAYPGDYRMLADCIKKCLDERKRLSANAREDAVERWGWEKRIEQYANMYKRTYEWWYQKRPKVSVIVTCYNLATYIEDCLNSVLKQTTKDFECIVVDDFSTDNTQSVVSKFTDKRIKYFKTPKNLGLSGARNFGISKSSGKYVIMLDADDMFDQNSLLVLSEELDKQRGVHIAYGHLDVVKSAEDERKRNNWPFPQFDWRGQMAHLNQLPYSAMVRREVFEWSGGYRARNWRAEDAALWCKLTSFGFVAKKVTEMSTLVYRDRSDSKSKGEPGDGDWTAWYSWRIAGNAREGKRILDSGYQKNPDPDIVPFGAQGKPPYEWKAWPVHDRSYPKVSVIIPVGPGHERYAIDAVESVMSQTVPDWEVIVVNDTGTEWNEGFFDYPLEGAPYAKLISTGGKKGTAVARNMGATLAKAGSILFLDADDMLLPTALERMLAYLELNNGIIYSDWLKSESDRAFL